MSSEDRPRFQDGAKKVTGRSTWVSMAIFLVLQFLIFLPEGMQDTLDVQFARSKFARERNFTIPVGINACATSNQSSVLTDIQSETALFSTYQNFLTDFIPVLAAMPLIALTDYSGRRPILLLRCFGALVMAIGFLVVSIFDLSVYYTLIGSSFFGISGGYVLLNSLSLLYVTDIVPSGHRGVALAIIYATETTFLYLGPLIINILLESLSSFAIVYLITACFALMACLWMLPPNLIQESVPAKQPIDLRSTKDYTKTVRRLIANTTNGQRWRIFALLASDALLNLNLYGLQNTINLYGLGQPFCWSPALVGIFSVVYGIPNAIVAPFIVWLMGLFFSEYWLIYLCILSGIAEFLLTAVATTNAVLIYGASLAGIFFGISQPVFVHLLIGLVDTKSHGALFSLYSLTYSATQGVSAIIQSYGYSIAVKNGHAVVLFATMAVLTGLVFIPTIMMHVLQPRDDLSSHGLSNNGLSINGLSIDQGLSNPDANNIRDEDRV